VKLSHTFRDPRLLEQALTHPSWLNEHPATADNQRLEFLGDAVVGLVVTELLYEAHPDWQEGELSRARAALVGTESFAALAEHLGLPGQLRRERGMVQPGRKVLADAFEAVVAAVWLDGGLEAARAFVRPLFEERARALEQRASVDARSRLQELLEGQGKPRPEYTVDHVSGPAHARIFHTSVLADGRRFGPAPGASKRASAAAAAALALAELDA
jgi:ribonuclease-3